jgi:hypothetical protein
MTCCVYTKIEVRKPLQKQQNDVCRYFNTKIEVCKPLQKQENDVCRYFMIGHGFLQQHTRLDIVGSPTTMTTMMMMMIF